MDEPLTFMERAHYLWVCSFASRNTQLHAVRSRLADGGTITMCGRTIARAFLPRPWNQKKPRCRRCCRQTQLPTGMGSPVHDRECRIAAGWPADKADML